MSKNPCSICNNPKSHPCHTKKLTKYFPNIFLNYHEFQKFKPVSITEIEELEKLYRMVGGGRWYAPKSGDPSPKSCGCHSDYPTFQPGCANEYEVWTEDNESEEWPSILTGFENEVKLTVIMHEILPRLLHMIKKKKKK